MPNAPLYRLFVDPPAEMRPMPFWVWNDDLDPRCIREQLRGYKRAGMGGVFVHPRPGLISEYLGPQWWKCFDVAIQEAKKLGLQLHIYDENSYPSGFAGGHVPAQLPYAVATGMTFKTLDRGEAPSGQALAGAEVGGKRYAFVPTPARTTPWLGGFAYVDLLRPEVMRAFLDITYEAYHQRHGREFGRSITMAFTDEPMIGNGGVYDGAPVLPYSPWLAAQFRRIKGYALETAIPMLFLDLPGYRKARYDYYDVLHGLFVESWAKPVQQWCRDHGIANTGHYMEHTWPRPYAAGTPDAMAMYEWMDVPGIDMLEARLGRAGVTQSIGLTPQLLLMTVRELLSVANQLGKKRTLCEMYGAGGYDSTFEDYKRMGDWLYVHGVNLQNQHLSYMTLYGARKRDHPQTFGAHAPWWGQYGKLCDYFGRLSTILSLGRMRQRILLLHPTTTGWLEADPIGQSPGIKRLYDAHTQLVQELCDRFWDFDLGDEFILSHHGKVNGRRMEVGRQRYDVVIMPAGMTHVRADTARLLETFTKRGGIVLAMGAAPSLVDGVPDDRLKASARSWRRISGTGGLNRALEEIIGRQVDIRTTPAGVTGVALMRRELDAHTACYFLTNTANRRVKLELSLKEKGRVERWDALSGEKQSIAGGGVKLELAHSESALLVVDTTPAASAPRHGSPRAVHHAAERIRHPKLLSIEATDANVLVIDYCGVRTGGRELSSVHHTQAMAEVTRAHGFERPIWDNAVQFKRNLLDQDHFPADSGFEAEYVFEVKHQPAAMELAVERPELYRIEVNGKAVSVDKAPTWLDRHIRSAPIAGMVRKGRNAVRLIAHPFKVRMELEPIYLRGDFSLVPANRGFIIDKPRSLAIGSWRDQGRPFYAGAVRYRYEFEAADAGARRIVRLPSWAGAVASVALNGKDAGIIGWPAALSAQGGYELDVTRHARRGHNELCIEVIATLKNLLGPFHCHQDGPFKSGDQRRTPPRGSAWPVLWFDSPRQGPPSGKHYDGIDYGLFALPELIERDNQT